MRWVRAWLARPQKTNRDALVVGLVGAGLFAALLWCLSRLLELLDLLDPGWSVPAWIVAVGGGMGLAIGLVAGRASSRPDDLAAIHDYEVYSEHLRDVLRDLRRLVGGELPAITVRDYIEKAIFEPAHVLLTRTGARGDVRFSVLHEDAGVFRMSNARGMFPALGHSIEARQRFELPVEGSFAGAAFASEDVLVSNDLLSDQRWRPHPRSRPGREYRAMVSVPVRKQGRVDGVLNVIASRAHAFSSVDRTYIVLLGAVVEVARAVAHEDAEAGQV